jgi:hypothetical protein
VPSPVSQIFDRARLKATGVVRWGEPIPEVRPGVYVVALTAETGSTADAIRDCPLDQSAVESLLHARPELRLDGKRPTAAELADRLAALWLDDETVVYIGLAATSVYGRVTAYYLTPLGARSPHAGGWPLKTLSVLGSLWVHYAPCADPAAAEQEMLAVFASGVSAGARAKLRDPLLPVPFANLERAKGERKQHGITGTRAPRKRAGPTATKLTPTFPAESPDTRDEPPEATTVRPSCTRHATTHAGPLHTQRITKADISAGRIRVPSSTKSVFPDTRTEVQIKLRGADMDVRWHPHYDPDQERSGVLSVGAKLLATLVEPGEILTVTVSDGRVLLT